MRRLLSTALLCLAVLVAGSTAAGSSGQSEPAVEVQGEEVQGGEVQGETDHAASVRGARASGTPGLVPDAGEARPLSSVRPGEVVAEAVFFDEVGWPVALPRPSLVAQRRQSGGDRIVVPQLDAAMPVVRAPVRGGRMLVPRGVERVGWLSTSMRAGSRTGVTTLATHRDTGGGGRGVRSPLFDLEQLTRGATISVRFDGKTTRYRVTRLTYHQPEALPAGLTNRTGPHRLALVSCGGGLRLGPDGVWRWAKRIVVWARAAETVRA